MLSNHDDKDDDDDDDDLSVFILVTVDNDEDVDGDDDASSEWPDTPITWRFNDSVMIIKWLNQIAFCFQQIEQWKKIRKQLVILD